MPQNYQKGCVCKVYNPGGGINISFLDACKSLLAGAKAIKNRFENDGFKNDTSHMRRFFSRLTRPVFFSLILFLLKLQGMKRKRYGKSSFWGSEEFLKLCDMSLGELKDLDQGLFSEMMANRKLYFYSTDKRNEQVVYAGVFGLNKGFQSWGTKGVIARVVYAFYVSESMQNRTFSRNEIPFRESLHLRAKEQTRSWLKSRNFPSALVELFN